MEANTTPANAPQPSIAAPAPPLPPAERELEILRRILGAARIDGAGHLIDQLRMLQVAGGSDATCRIYLLHPDAPRSPFSRDGRARLPGSFPVRSSAGDRVIGEFTVVVDHGHLRALQYVPHDARTTLTLPDPDQVELPGPDVPPAVRGHGARQALDGVRAVSAPEPEAAPAAPRTWLRRLALGALAACVVAATVLAFLGGRSDGVDVDAARNAGAAQGQRDGALHGFWAGSFTGALEGELGGRASTYQTAYDTARAQTLIAARRAALQRRRDAAAAAAAAAAATSFPNPSTCFGYRDSAGNWICT